MVCYSHMIRYIIIWHVLSKSLYIYTYEDTGIMEMDSVTGSIYLEYPGADRHHLNIRYTHSIFPSSWSYALLPSFHGSTQFVWILPHSCQSFIDPRNLCGSSGPGIRSYPLTLFLYSSSKNPSFSQIHFGYHATCGTVLMKDSLPSSSSISPHGERVNIQMLAKAVIDRVWRCTWKALIMRTSRR